MVLELGINKLTSLQQRILTALIALPIVIGAVYFGSPYFDLLTGFILIAMIREWSSMTLKSPNFPVGYLLAAVMLSLIYTDLNHKKYILFALIVSGMGLAYHAVKKRNLADYLIFIIGSLYLSWSIYILIHLIHEGLAAFFLWILLIIWSSDTGAYFTGKSIGGPKLAPSISPNKTWAGFFGGCLTATVIGVLTGPYLQKFYTSVTALAMTAFVLSLVSHSGDLLESYLKRHYGVKDSGTFLPGHGGFLDRLDSLLLVSFAAGLLLILGL
ncbi:MAG: phosphatidate cytidylyltransferase [Candidatus Paracaedibacteraceae bacterium]|nr:phosphatidate cytidylyltransferase [Candidatus Paracaedibacteraceae bacterium]